MAGLERRIRILEVYALVSTAILGVSAFTDARGAKQHIPELSVERLNVIERDGRLRAVIADEARMPDPIVNGRPFKTERPPGMLFYNGLGDECGGLIFGAAQGSRYGAYGGLSFDQYKQSQSVAVVYNDHAGRLQSGLSVWERPTIPISEVMRRQEEIARLPESVARSVARAGLEDSTRAATRVFVGRTPQGEAIVRLCDLEGHPRAELVVDSLGVPRLDFLSRQGAVIRSLRADDQGAR